MSTEASDSEAIGQNNAQRFLAAIVALTALRFVAGAVLPLSADEAYYWLWSKHLAAGYYDHPPAIAYAIRFGTLLFSATPLGVRFGALLLSVLASWFVWRAAESLDRGQGARACLFFNLTLMISVETLAATPDAPSIAAAAGFLYALAKVHETGKGGWWLAAGAAAGLGLLSKYTILFLGAGAVVWLLLAPKARPWLLTGWPYLGGVIAVLVFLPNLLWNAQHDWMTVAFQFGRIGEGQFTLRYLFEFLGAQLLLASPFLFVLAALSLAFASRDRNSPLFLLAALIFPSALYFLVHSLHDRIQGNWPSFLYPALALAAAEAFRRTDWQGWTTPVWRLSRAAATPVAAALVLVIYAQALFGVVPLGRGDPLARLLAVGMEGVAQKIETADGGRAAAILTTDYATTSWLSFYLPHRPVIAVGEDYRYPNAPAADAVLLDKPLLYVTEERRDKHALIAQHFAHVAPVLRFARERRGVPIAHYVAYAVNGRKGPPVGRRP